MTQTMHRNTSFNTFEWKLLNIVYGAAVISDTALLGSYY